ncbi:hypothetical protein N7532_010178 [Penicillium argentinense]|uniref:Uncharacterized protein n=1 Tax=Penicillium argentinense TaxID=1131581 RepID=A0A9W9EP39_9EURO|nr:uncharacterized protein N7532_010178 [Penicillium argentinense]KAJ5085407.1 hypothetical protein N7532_010178 [Penicillium argentinense]
MQQPNLLSSFALLALIAAPSAASEETKQTITVPWVGYEGYAPNYFKDYEVWEAGSDGEKTTYTIACPSNVTSCIDFQPYPMTVVIAPNSYNVQLDAVWSTSSSGCTFSAGPTPTAASCSYTESYNFGTRTHTTTDSYHVPDESVFETIVSETLVIAGTGHATTTDSVSSTAIVTAAIASGGSETSSASVGASASQGSTASTNVASTTTSSNFAVKTPARLVLPAVGGWIAGAALQI